MQQNYLTMNMFRATTLFLSLLLTAAALPAMAQYDNDSGDVPSSARMDVRLSQLEEQMRKMEGAIEQLSYQNKQLKAQIDKSNGDTQYRLQALESKQAPVSGITPVGAAPQPPQTTVLPQPSDQMQPVQPQDDNGDDHVAVDPNPPQGTAPVQADTQRFATSRDHYNYAFRLMNQAKYADAGSSFAAFAQRYPHDPLIGNAFYWLGETYYVRRNYMQAADNFRQGYEAMPSGPKSGDNLLKLAMSLDAMKKDTEACVVLKQVASKYDGTSSVKPRAEQEMNRIGCN